MNASTQLFRIYNVWCTSAGEKCHRKVCSPKYMSAGAVWHVVPG